MIEPATERQVAYIKKLGGTPSPNLTKSEASDQIGKLLAGRATERKLKQLAKLGANIPEKLSQMEADKLIEAMKKKQPPTKSAAKLIRNMGGTVPQTRTEANKLIQKLRKTAPATEEQRLKITELGGELPDGCKYGKAENLISDLELDEGKPPTKAQLSQIAKLGGNPEKATNRYSADEYICELEDIIEETEAQFEDRIEEALEDFFGDPDSRESMDYKKPSTNNMGKALKYGDAQGWGEDWADLGGDNPGNPYSRMDEALSVITPNAKKAPRKPRETRSRTGKGKKDSGGSGCIIALLIAIGIFLYLAFQ